MLPPPLAEATTISQVPPCSQELVPGLDGNISCKPSLNNCLWRKVFIASKTPPSSFAGRPIIPWHSPRVLKLWKSWCRHVLMCQQKQSFAIPRWSWLCWCFGCTRPTPVQSRCPKSAIYASPCFLQRRRPELANGQIKEDCFHAEPAAHLMCSSPARPPHRIHGPARSREYRPDLPSIVAHVQGPRGRRIRRNPTSLVQAVGSSHLNCSTIRPASERSSAQPGPLAMRSADDNRPGSLWEAVCLRSVYSNSFMKCLL